MNLLSAEAERFFVRLIMKADDYGRYSADGRRLKAFLFPLKDSLRETDCARWLAECEQAGLVRCYEAAGKRYLELPNFRQRLRVMKESHPRPSDALNLAPDAVNLAPGDVNPLPVAANPPSDDGQMSAGCPLERKRSEAKGNETNGASPLARLEAGLNAAYGRATGFVWSYAEQSAVAEIARRPEAVAELETLLRYRRRLPAAEKRFFPNSIGSLLAKWTETLDKVAVSRPEPIRSTPPPVCQGPELSEAKRREFAQSLSALKKEL